MPSSITRPFTRTEGRAGWFDPYQDAGRFSPCGIVRRRAGLRRLAPGCARCEVFCTFTGCQQEQPAHKHQGQKSTNYTDAGYVFYDDVHTDSGGPFPIRSPRWVHYRNVISAAAGAALRTGVRVRPRGPGGSRHICFRFQREAAAHRRQPLSERRSGPAVSSKPLPWELGRSRSK